MLMSCPTGSSVTGCMWDGRVLPPKAKSLIDRSPFLSSPILRFPLVVFSTVLPLDVG